MFSGTPPARLQTVELGLERIGAAAVRHWLAIFVAATAVFSTLPFVAPILSAAGYDSVARPIYFAYRVTCHQLPHRSWFVAGDAAAYDWATVAEYMGLPSDANEARAFHQPIRDPVLGYQVAYCQRDTATWFALLGGALAFALLRRRRRVRPLPFRLYMIALIPVGVDGLAQMLGVHESTPLSRTATGALFGAATAWLVLPLLGQGFTDIATTQRRRCDDDDS